MRFTLLTLMLLMLFAAVLCGAFFALPGFWSVVVLAATMALLPAPIVAGICYGRGYGRAFAIGCASVGWAPVVLSSFTANFVIFDLPSATSDENGQLRIMYAIFFTLIIVAGVLSVIVRWLALRPARVRPMLGESPFARPSAD